MVHHTELIAAPQSYTAAVIRCRHVLSVLMCNLTSACSLSVDAAVSMNRSCGQLSAGFCY